MPGKVLSKILLNKIRKKTEIYAGGRQYGFRPNRDTVYAVFILRRLKQKEKERESNMKDRVMEHIIRGCNNKKGL